MNDYSQPRPGKIEVHGNGLGAPSSEEVERRAREIAMIDERNPDEFTDADWKQARRELMGEENNMPPEETTCRTVAGSFSSTQNVHRRVVRRS